MTLELQIEAVDAFDRAVPIRSLTAITRPESTPLTADITPTGATLFLPEKVSPGVPLDQATLNIAFADYRDLVLVVRPPAPGLKNFITNDPTTGVTSSDFERPSPHTVHNFTVRALRLAAAPMDTTSIAMLLQLPTKPTPPHEIVGGHPTGVLAEAVDPSGLKPPKLRGLADDDGTVGLAGPKVLADPTHRVSFDLKAANPATLGRLHLLEYGDPIRGPIGDPPQTMLVAVWTPNNVSHATIPAKFEYILWYHPSTDAARFKVNYPYGASVAGRHVDQPYVQLALGHLFVQHLLVHQALAAGRDATLVMVISPHGKWGPFETSVACERLLRELCIYLPRARAPLAFFASRAMKPEVGNVIVACFSEGGQHSRKLLVRTPTLPSGYDPIRWGAPPSTIDADQTFHTHWTEYWDFDTSHFQMPPNDAERLRHEEAQWKAASAGRILRSFVTATTVGDWRPNSKTEPDPDFRKLLQSCAPTSRIEHRRAPRSGDDTADEWQSTDGRFTSVRFSDNTVSSGYIGGPDGLSADPVTLAAFGRQFLVQEDGQPEPGHEIIPRVLFGHAARTTPGRPPP